MLRTLIFVVTLAIFSAPGFATHTDSEFGHMLEAPGVEETHAHCTVCHSEMIVAQQGKSRKNWEKLFGWMIEEQGMAEIEEPDLSIILDYLEEHYNEDRPNFPRP